MTKSCVYLLKNRIPRTIQGSFALLLHHVVYSARELSLINQEYRGFSGESGMTLRNRKNDDVET